MYTVNVHMCFCDLLKVGHLCEFVQKACKCCWHCVFVFTDPFCRLKGPCLKSPCNSSNTDYCNQTEDFYITNSFRQCICKAGNANLKQQNLVMYGCVCVHLYTPVNIRINMQ